MEYNVPDMSELRAFFQKAASEGYVENPQTGIYVPRRFVDPLETKPLIGFYEQIKSKIDMVNSDFQKENIPSLSRTLFESVARHFAFGGWEEFSYVGEGNTTICLQSNYQGNYQAIRFTHAPETELFHDDNMVFVRNHCPLNLLPEFTLKITEPQILVEISPLATVIDNEELYANEGVYNLYRTCVGVMLEGTCFERYGEIKDIAVLPDGTPVFVDADVVALKDPLYTPTEYDFAQIKRNCEAIEWPKELSFIMDDGRFKQEKFYDVKPASEPPDFTI